MPIAASVQDCLRREGIQYNTIVHSHTLDSVRSAQAAHVSGDRLAKCVLLKDHTGYVMAIMPASHRLDMQTVRCELNRELGLAAECELSKLFVDCELGAIPPLGRAYGIDVIVDRSLADAPDVYFEAGDHSSLVHVSGRDFLKLMANAPQRYISHHL
jgi:Ala-tRNA(Pro) deacylase